MSANLNSNGLPPVQNDSFIRKARMDSYKVQRKLPEPNLCPGCGAVFKEGRWQWQELAVAHEALCPPCDGQCDNSPAGYVALSGSFVASHETKVLGIVRGQEGLEKVQYPPRRVMSVEKLAEGLMVTTTDVRLAHDIGKALRKAFDGALTLNYNRRTNMLLAHWSR